MRRMRRMRGRAIEMLVVKTAWLLSFILSSLRTERPNVAVKLINTRNRNSVAAAIPVETGTSEPLAKRGIRVK